MFHAKVSMKKISFLFVLFLLISGGIFVGTHVAQDFIPSYHTSVSPSLSNNQAYDHENIINAPTRLIIPAIGVDAYVEEVGQDTQGRMDVPKQSDDVGWYHLGFKPGEQGNAVFAGHLDRATGAPAVFWNISELNVGDEIFVKGEQGKTLTFAVTKTGKYPYDNFPLEEVFGSSDKAQLNLITCGGSWDATKSNYSHRYVVYAEKAPK